MSALLLALALLAAAGGLSLFYARADTVVSVGPATAETIGSVHFGGPDLPPGALRDLLLRRIQASPPGSRIDWATYYFLDRALADALIAASHRGVRVCLIVEGDPRLGGANIGVLALLRHDGLNGGLLVRRRADWPLRGLSGKLHIKVYAFSYPRPVALVGSFNPSGAASDAVIREIGDQDRGHNLLVEITGSGLVRTLVAHIERLAAGQGSVSRFTDENNTVYREGGTQLYFYPRLRFDPLDPELDSLGRGDRVWAAISHLKNEAVGTLVDAAERGAGIELVVHDTERRVPEAVIIRLRAAGIHVRRYRQAQGYPMHAKFFLIQRGGRDEAWFGSLNFNRNSRLLNDEVLVRSADPRLFAMLLARFQGIEAEIDKRPV